MKDYKETEIGIIPNDWDLVALKDVANINMGQSPSSSTYNNLEIGMPFYQGKTDFGFINPIKRMYCSAPSKCADANDILISVRAPVGPVNITTERCCIGRGLAAIKSKSFTDQAFLYFYLIYQEERIAAKGTGSTFKAINKNQLIDFPVPKIPEKEQRNISHILSLIQSAIQKQEQIINTTTELKNTLMKKLFIEGMNNEPLKKTEIGLIPESWKVVELDDVCEIVRKSYQPVKNGSKFYIGLEHMLSGVTKIYSHGFESEIVSSKNQFKAGQIIYGKLRPYLDKATIPHFDGICSSDILVFDGKNEVANPFLIHFFHSERFINYAKASTTGVQHPRTSWNALKKLKFGLPKKNEGEEISYYLNTLINKIEFHNKKRKTLESLFNSMLHQLMTGKLRIKNLQPDKAYKLNEVQDELSLAAEP